MYLAHLFSLLRSDILTQERQIRNAFQTAIALVEHDALRIEEGQPIPTLGKAQFDIVADASRQFDVYLTQAIGKGENDMAVYDRWRADSYAKDPEPVGKRGKSGADKVRDIEEPSDDSSSDDSSEDDLEDDEDEDALDASGKKQGGKAANGGLKKEEAEASAASKGGEDKDDEMAQFEAFMRFQAMKKKGKMA